VKGSSQKLNAEGGGFSFSVSKTTAVTVSFAP